MGATKIDIERGDRIYFNTSLSNEEDIIDILYTIDAVKQDAEKGNKEALVVLIDFENLFLKNDICKEYYSIITGENPYTVDDYGKDIITLIAERFFLSKQYCEEVIRNTVKEMVNENKEKWILWLNKNYKGKYILKIKEKPIASKLDDSTFYLADFNRKYVVNNKMYKELGYPQDLQELIDIQKVNQEKINELEQLKKNKTITKTQREQLRKRINFNIDLVKDISLLKQHYNIPIKNTNNKGKIEFVSLSEADLDLTETNYNDYIFDERQLDKIKEIAYNVLTEKQLVIFNLYYISEFTQQQIADLIGETKGHISRDLKVSLEKIRKNL